VEQAGESSGPPKDWKVQHHDQDNDFPHFGLAYGNIFFGPRKPQTSNPLARRKSTP
jgi:hypothetical protein